jgi:hypothetical protein
VFIDHLHFIVPFSAERQDLRIGETMWALKTMAKKWTIVIFLIVHLKKTCLDTAPDLEDLHDSSFIAQESATMIILMVRGQPGPGRSRDHGQRDRVGAGQPPHRQDRQREDGVQGRSFLRAGLGANPARARLIGPMLHNVEDQ